MHGKAKRVRIEKENTTIIEGAGKKQEIEGRIALAAREGKSERSIRMTLSLVFISPSWRKPRCRVVFHADSASNDLSTCRWYGPSNGAPSDCRRRFRRRPNRVDSG
jgi:hypothetical protein